MKIDYIELTMRNSASIKGFYGAAFGWTFEDWGDEYLAFSADGMQGGFRKTAAQPPRGGTLLILKSEDLQSSEKIVADAGGKIIEHHDFPGGKRFHFLDPAGNELAVWMEVPLE